MDTYNYKKWLFKARWGQTASLKELFLVVNGIEVSPQWSVLNFPAKFSFKFPGNSAERMFLWYNSQD
ncbi:hypothetical protein LZY01_11610 [Levilactobacillus zymae]|uniref:Uncharacterized protein n=1 Tax=Levilactobacillus zymae TaxID=267363 RepID=A0ABQ0WWU2_9LACO|nr:hypothetical protein LZY01_11610 [Levilactobacillus zymae]